MNSLPRIILRPGDVGYKAASLAWHGARLEPEHIIVARSLHDVQESMRFANANGSKVSIYASGHDSHPKPGALLLNLSMLNYAHMTDRQSVVIGGGTKWQRIIDLVAPRGFGVPLGSSPDVAVPGFATGGGIGPFLQRHGYCCNSIIRITGVTPSGNVITLTPSDGPVFAALCGGGSNFLCVTELEIALFPLMDNVLGGDIAYPIGDAQEVLERYRSWVESLDSAWTTSIRFESETVKIRGCCCDTAQFRKLYDWLQWRKPVNYRFNLLPFSAIAEVAQDPLEPPDVRLYGGDLLSDIPDSVLAAWRVGKPFTLEFRRIGGAKASKTSVLGLVEQANYTCLMGGGEVVDEQALAEQIEYVAVLRRAFGSSLLPGLYRNFNVDRHSQIYRSYSPLSLAYMIRAKRQFDPLNVIVSDTPLGGAAIPLLQRVSTNGPTVSLELTGNECWPTHVEAYLLATFDDRRPEQRIEINPGILPPTFGFVRPDADSFSMRIVVNDGKLVTVHPFAIISNQVITSSPFCFENAS